jgi:rubrerythrin
MAKDPENVDLSKRNFFHQFTGVSALAALTQLLGPVANPHLAIIAAQKPSPGGDVALLNEAIKLEQKAINTYQAALQADLIKSPVLVDAAFAFASDHQYHRETISRFVRGKLKGLPPIISDDAKIGTFPIPEAVLKGKDNDVLRYALTLEVIASKTYLEFVNGKLNTPEAKGLVASILAVEVQHAATIRTALMLVLKDKGLAEDKQLVPFPFFDQQPTPEIPA